MATKNGTEGRVYGGDCELVHIEDGMRQLMGDKIAYDLDTRMRRQARLNGSRTAEQAYQQNLCPGCYMIAAFNMLVTLARQNGQDMRELGLSMAEAFGRLADGTLSEGMEEIDVILDTEH